MNKASNFSISTHNKAISLLIGLVLGFLVIHITKELLDNDEPAKCPQDMIAQGYTCVFPKDPSQDPCATGAAKIACGRNDPNEPLGDPVPRPPAPPAKNHAPPAPPKAENSEPIIPQLIAGLIPNDW